MSARRRATAADDRARVRANVRAAAIAAILFGLVTAAVFLKENPFSHGYQIRARFSSVNQLRMGADVRTAGSPIGSVVGIAGGPHNTSIVTMRIDQSGRPIHADATATIDPRLILEGNAYIDLDPGSPSAPELRSGGMLPLSQTAVAVQIDQVLDLLTQPGLHQLHGAISALADGFGRGSAPNPVAVTPGYKGLREAVRELDDALPNVSEVAQAAQGTEPGDLTRAIASSGDVAAQLAESPKALAGIVTDISHVMGVFASEHNALSASISQFDALVRVAPGALDEIDQALPPLTRFADAVRPALQVAPSSLRSADRLVAQISAFTGRSELPLLLDRLAPALQKLPTVEGQLKSLFPLTMQVTDCITTHVIPALDMKVQDGPRSTGDPTYLNLAHALTGLTSFASSFDGNGGTGRLGITGTERLISSILPGVGNIIAAVPNATGVSPAWLGYGVNPPFRPDQQCANQPLPNLQVGTNAPIPEWAKGTN